MSVSLRESTANASCFAARHFVFEVLCALGVSAVRFCSQVILEVLNFMGEYGNSSVTIRIPQSRIEQVASLA
jgi:hypothetical protein